MIERDWYKCYGQGWGELLVPDAFAHPAKFSRKLIKRIYEHAIEQGYLEPGSTVLDPFGGVALGAIYAMQNGLHWIGCELEEKFVGLGNQNIDLWNARFSRMPRWGTATLLQGDSRELGRVLGKAGAVVSSPPYAKTAVAKSSDGVNLHKQYETYQSQGGGASFEAFCATQRLHSQGYGSGSGQLAAMNPGDHDAVVSSPPYAESLASDDPDKRGGLFRDPKRRGDKTLTAEYGASPGQLGEMKAGELGAVVSSPPYAESLGDGKSGIDWGKQADRETDHPHGWDGETYGRADGQLGRMKAGDLDAMVSSPPWQRGAEGALRKEKFKDPEAFAAAMSANDGQGTRNATTPASRLAQMERDSSRVYGDSEGQLGAMSPGSLDGAVSSPPYEKQGEGGGIAASMRYESDYPLTAQDGGLVRTKQAKRSTFSLGYQNQTDDSDNLANGSGETFWAAARQIMEQCYQALAPGAVAIWVLKGFVRKKKYVDFPDQWRQLGEACGFESLEWIRAWLVEDRGAQWDLWGSLEERTVERKSFFRRLYEKKARAEKHWNSVARSSQATFLLEARVYLWVSYKLEMMDHDKPPKRPSPAHIRERAYMAAYEAAGCPAIEIDTSIDFEVVLVQRKPQ